MSPLAEGAPADLLAALDLPHWTADAACTIADARKFDTTPRGSEPGEEVEGYIAWRARISEAAAVCARCPLAGLGGECLNDALANGDYGVIRGGYALLDKKNPRSGHPVTLSSLRYGNPRSAGLAPKANKKSGAAYKRAALAAAQSAA